MHAKQGEQQASGDAGAATKAEEAAVSAKLRQIPSSLEEKEA